MEVVHSDEEVRWIGANLTAGGGTIRDLPYESNETNDKANYETTECTFQRYRLIMISEA